ncbi:hypothetical protein [Helicobacter cetorum]|uniref:PBECR3 domain-containing polyvalent protein n=1 Tax=Helicobacter cetorum TaxID=138563 RepID=UPI001F375303|nr:hypothetical protein [Helicobacter cetorum]
MANYRKIANSADEVIKTRGNNNELRILSFKQENGYYVIVEQVSKKHNEINLVTMFKEKGNYKNGNTYIKATQKFLRILIKNRYLKTLFLKTKVLQKKLNPFICLGFRLKCE